MIDAWEGGALRDQARRIAERDLTLQQIETARLRQHGLRFDSGPEPEGVVILDIGRAGRDRSAQREAGQNAEERRPHVPHQKYCSALAQRELG